MPPGSLWAASGFLLFIAVTVPLSAAGDQSFVLGTWNKLLSGVWMSKGHLEQWEHSPVPVNALAPAVNRPGEATPVLGRPGSQRSGRSYVLGFCPGSREPASGLICGMNREKWGLHGPGRYPHSLEACV